MDNIEFKDYKGKTYEVSPQGIDEFVAWVKSNPRCIYCKLGIVEGGPGFYGFGHCEAREEVRYGGVSVEAKTCEKYEEKGKVALIQLYLSLCAHHPAFYCTSKYKET